MPSAFQVFGIVAGRELSGNAKVREGMTGMVKFMDQAELTKLDAEASASAGK